MRAAIITIGDELLIGQTIDTNSAWIGSHLSSLGFDIVKKISIHDKEEDIFAALNEIIGKVEVAIVTGGLGPTRDDITKRTLCRFFETSLRRDESVLSNVRDMMLRRGIELTENNMAQADVPACCTVLENSAGTAPGMWFEKGGTIFISMPGVPFEMQHIMTEQVLPRLKSAFDSQTIVHKTIVTAGLAESLLSIRLTDFEDSLPQSIKLAYLPDSGIIKLRLTGMGADCSEVEESVACASEKLKGLIPELIIGEDIESVEAIIAKLLIERGECIGTAESCTGGNIARCITANAGSSAYYKGSVVAYSNLVKESVLGVSHELLSMYGAVSREVVESMAEGAKKLLNVDYAVATSGIAGPDGGSKEKPVGTAWIAVASRKGVVSQHILNSKNRANNIERFTKMALNLLRKEISK